MDEPGVITLHTERFDNPVFRYRAGYVLAQGVFRYFITNDNQDEHDLPPNITCVQDGVSFDDDTLLDEVKQFQADDIFLFRIEYRVVEAGIYQCIITDVSNGSEMLFPHPIRRDIGECHFLS